MAIKEIIQGTNSIVANRLKFVVDILDLDSVEKILDIGSWHLKQSIEFMDLFPDANVFAFEANPSNYQNCKNTHNNLSGFYKKNLKVYDTALNDKPGKINFYPVVGDNPGASSKYKFMDGLTQEYWNATWNQTKIEVDATTLDLWCAENKIDNVDIIWIDVQGAELDVFRGGKEVLKDVKCIFTEVGLKPYYEGQALKSEIDKFLIDECGFVEIEESFEYNGSDCEANTIYVKSNLL